MEWAEIILIVVGVGFIIASFFITERLSEQDLEQISMMSETELKRISDKQVKTMRDRLENELEDIIDESLIVTQRGLEKETNSKIMAVSEYSETVLETINKSHNEITFLYSMLNEKQAETAQLVGDLQKVAKQLRDMDLENNIARAEAVAGQLSGAEVQFEPIVAPVVEVADTTTGIEVPVVISEHTEKLEEMPALSKNEQILLLYKEGKDEVEIAKTLNCGLGEVRLVLGLYHNEA